MKSSCGKASRKTSTGKKRILSLSPDESRPYTFDEYAQRFNRTMGIGTADPFKMLLGNNKIKNHSLNFVQGIEN